MQLARSPSIAALTRHSDLVLAAGVVAIVAMMVLPLPRLLIDALVAVNIASGVALLLVALYIPAPVAFSSFPSVLLITTLFRLSLSIATTRMILLEADAGDIIQTFGDLVAGGNLIVGLVVFIIITVVQFIVIAKGAERVAEVAARFTLDAMPGKQLSIDSDLRSGLIDKEEAKRKRKMLELESQLHGSLDGAMKFVKNDAVASIIIILVNIIGGLGIGILMRNMSVGEAFRTYSILTVGEGMVAQIPALLSAMAAGLIVTRTASEDADSHLGQAISRQLFAQPKVFLVSGFVATLLVFVPGFPWMVFICLALMFFAIAYILNPEFYRATLERLGVIKRKQSAAENNKAAEKAAQFEFQMAVPLKLLISADLKDELPEAELRGRLAGLREEMFLDLGVPLPEVRTEYSATLTGRRYRLLMFEVPLAEGQLPAGYRLRPRLQVSAAARALLLPPPQQGAKQDQPQESALGEWIPAKGATPKNDAGLLEGIPVLMFHVRLALRRHASHFLGIQEVNQMLGRTAQQYPDLVKEALRVLPLQRISDVMKRLVEEDISIRNMRDILESIAEWGAREKDIVMLAEYVRLGLKRYLSDKHAGPEREMFAILLHPDLEDQFRKALQVTNAGTVLALDPEQARRVINSMHEALGSNAGQKLILLSAMDVRRYVRKLLESDFPDLPVLSYGELENDIDVKPVAHIQP